MPWPTNDVTDKLDLRDNIESIVAAKRARLAITLDSKRPREWRLAKLSNRAAKLGLCALIAGGCDYNAELAVNLQVLTFVGGGRFQSAVNMMHRGRTPCNGMCQRVASSTTEPPRGSMSSDRRDHRSGYGKVKHVMLLLVKPMQSTRLRDQLTSILLQKLQQELVDETLAEEVEREEMSQKVEETRWKGMVGLGLLVGAMR